jgi:tRNA modification GTPase
VRRARAWADAAALRIWVVDGAACDGAWREAADLVRPGDLLALNKSDLPAGGDRKAVASMDLDRIEVVATSGDVAALKAALSARVIDALSGAEFPAVTRARHLQLLGEALARLRQVDAAALEAPELAAEDLRLAARAMERITGRIGAEDVLDVVFGAFCIGK